MRRGGIRRAQPSVPSSDFAPGAERKNGGTARPRSRARTQPCPRPRPPPRNCRGSPRHSRLWAAHLRAPIGSGRGGALRPYAGRTLGRVSVRTACTHTGGCGNPTDPGRCGAASNAQRSPRRSRCLRSPTALGLCTSPPPRSPKEPLAHPRPLPFATPPEKGAPAPTLPLAPTGRTGRGCGAHFPLPARPASAPAPAGAPYRSLFLPLPLWALSAVGCGTEPPDPAAARGGFGPRSALPARTRPSLPLRAQPLWSQRPRAPPRPPTPRPAAPLPAGGATPKGRAGPGALSAWRCGRGRAAGLAPLRRKAPRPGRGRRRAESAGGGGGGGPAAPRGRTGGCGTPHRTSGRLAGGHGSPRPRHRNATPRVGRTRDPGSSSVFQRRSAPKGLQTPLLPPPTPLPSNHQVVRGRELRVGMGTGEVGGSGTPHAPPAMRGPCGATRGRCRPVGIANTGGAAGTAEPRSPGAPPAVSRRPPREHPPPRQHLERRCPHITPPPPVPPGGRRRNCDC